MQFQKVQLPKVEFIDGGKVAFKKTATLEDVAIFLEVNEANECGLYNSRYAVGSEFDFASLASGETLCGCFHTFKEEKKFEIRGVLLKDKKTLILKYKGSNSNPEFQSLLEALGLQEEIKIGASEN